MPVPIRLEIGVLLLSLTATFHGQSQDAFDAQVDAGGGGGGEIYAFAVQPDGRILVGGQIYRVAGQPRSGLVRLHSDGRVDPDFHGAAAGYGLSNPYAGSLILQTDGRILVSGVFYTLSGQARTNIGRLNADGTVDDTFQAAVGQDRLNVGPLLGIQADGKILANAAFTDRSGQRSNFLARLNADGSLDPGFKQPAVGPGPYARIASVAFQEEGKMLVGGTFFTLGGLPATNLARLHADGTPDASFATPTFDLVAPWLATHVDVLALQADGRILVGGSFSSLNGVARTHFARLNADGSLDGAFDPQISQSIGVRTASAVVLQTDGKIWIGGYFNWFGAGQAYGLGRLNPDGSRDETFDASLTGQWIHALAVQADGGVLVGGDVYWNGERAPTDVVRLRSRDAATQALSFDGSAITWRRSGASPEVSRTSFEGSTNGVEWFSLGAGKRVTGGWECRPVACPPTATIRARGFVQGGEGNRSSWFTETMIGPPGITTHPVTRTNHAGTTAEFSVLAGGTAPVSYEWFKDGSSLADSRNIFGAHTPTLTLSNVIASDTGSYSVVIGNAVGRVTSTQAMLHVVDPAINVQPVSQLAQGGLPITLSVTAGGTPPLSYQWRKDGTNLPEATASTLAFTALQWSDRGSYAVVVSNSFGCITSETAVLTVNLASPDNSLHSTSIIGAVTSLALQPDGKILVASEWSEVSEPSRYYFVRLHADGTPDDTFDASLDPDLGAVMGMAVQPDGRILVGGWFTRLGGGARTNLARLHPNGTLDTTFHLDADNPVDCLIALPDGKTMVGGTFSSLGGMRSASPARLNADGTLDAGFQSQADGVFYNNLLAVLSDGKVLAGAQQVNSNGWSFCRIERLLPEGARDPAFANPEAQTALSYAEVHELAVTPDGSILVLGFFDSLAGAACTNFGRLNADGTFDATFANPHPVWTYGGAGSIDSVAFQTDGRLLASGYFLTIAGQTHRFMARFEANGALDETINPDPTAPAAGLAIQPDGKILAGGWFGLIAGADYWSLARLNNTGPALESLRCDGSTVTWLRLGASPEIGSAAFEGSSEGPSWRSLGTGTRIPGGWQLTGVDLPAGATVRARGLIAAAGSSWFVESTAIVDSRIQPRILSNEVSFGVRSNRFAFEYTADVREAVIIERSHDLVTWIGRATNVVGSGAAYFSDSCFPAAPQQFYRVRLWP